MPKAVVIGGGIGGLTAGLFFKKMGWEVIVCEAALELLPVGKGIWVPTNAMKVLESLNLASRVASAGWALSAIELETLGGTKLGSVDLAYFQQRLGHTTVSIRRSELVRILAEGLGPDCLRLNSRFQRLEEYSGKVLAHLASGDSLEADLLVGADGINSLVREVILPGVRLLDTGQSCARGIARFKLPPDLARHCQEIWGGAFRFGFSAIGPDEVYWFAPFLDPNRCAAKPLKAFLLDAYADFPLVVVEILRNTAEEEMILNRLEELPRLNTWTKGRILLLGDAAHAMTPNLGQGGAQAMEDAYLLAQALAGAKSESKFQDALTAFCQKRIQRVNSIANTARFFGQIAHWENSLACWLRDLALRNSPQRVNMGRLERIYRIPIG